MSAVLELQERVNTLMAAREFDEALPLVEELSVICRQRGNWKAYVTCLLNIAGIHYEKSRDIGHVHALVAAISHAEQAFLRANDAYRVAVENGIVDMIDDLDVFRRQMARHAGKSVR